MKRTEVWHPLQCPKQALSIRNKIQFNSFWHSIKTTHWSTEFISVFCSCVLSFFLGRTPQTTTKRHFNTFCDTVYTLAAADIHRASGFRGFHLYRNKKMWTSLWSALPLGLFPDEVQRQITKSLLKQSINSFTLSGSEGVLPVTDLTCNEKPKARPEICSHVSAQVLQLRYFTFAHVVSRHPLWWQKLVVGFWVFLHVLECRFFYNLLDGCFTQVFP